MPRFLLVFLLLAYLFTPMIAPSADPVTGGEEEEEGDPDSPADPQPASNLCSGRCYSTADGSAQGYSCSLCPDSNCAVCNTLQQCTLCFDGFLESGGSCYSNDVFQCPGGCTACDTSKKCLQCDENYFLNGDSCVILCPQKKFGQTPSTSPSCESPKCANCPNNCLKCTDANTCTQCDTGFDLIGATCVPSCSAGSYHLDALTCAPCPSECTACSSPKKCTACANPYVLDVKTSSCNKPTTVATVTTQSKTVTAAATQVTNLLSPGKSIAMSASVCGKILTNIRYINITYSSKLQGVFDTWETSVISFGFNFDMPDSLESKIPARHVPYVFSKYDIPSSFLVNFWDNIYVLSGVFLFFLGLYGIEYIYEKSVQTEKSLLKVIIKTCRIYIQNFFVTLLFGIYGDALLFSIIEYQSIKFEWNIALLSFVTSLFFLLLAVLSFTFHIQLLLKYQSLKKSHKSQSKNLEKFIQDTKGTEVLYKDYQDTSIWTQAFLPFLILRDIGFSAILASLFHFPLAQILLIFTLNVAMLLYLVICKPFKDRLDLIQQIFFEVAGLTVNVSVLVNGLLSDRYEESLAVREHIGDGIILTNMLFNFITAGFMALKLLMLLKDLYLAYKLKNAKNPPAHSKKQASESFTNSPSLSSSSKNTSVSRLNNSNNSFISQEDSLPIQEISSFDQLPLNKNSRYGPSSNFQVRFNSNSRSPARNPRRLLEIPQGNVQQEITGNSQNAFQTPQKEDQPKKIDSIDLGRKRILSLQNPQNINGGIKPNINQYLVDHYKRKLKGNPGPQRPGMLRNLGRRNFAEKMRVQEE